MAESPWSQFLLAHHPTCILSLWKYCWCSSGEFWPIRAEPCAELPKTAPSFCQLEFLSLSVCKTLCVASCLQCCCPFFGRESRPFQDFQTFLPRTRRGLLSIVFLGPPCGFSCSFEKDFCSWSQSSTDSFDWRRHKGPTPSPDTGPLYDHTTGGEAGIEWSILTSQKNKSSLFSFFGRILQLERAIYQIESNTCSV